jgi:hypothetical protein
MNDTTIGSFSKENKTNWEKEKSSTKACNAIPRATEFFEMTIQIK